MEFFAAIGAGLIGGLVGVIPFLVARSRIKRRLKTDGTGSIVTGMAAVLVSFVIMAIQIAICFFVAKDYLLPFSLTTIAVLLLAMGAYTATLVRR